MKLSRFVRDAIVSTVLLVLSTGAAAAQDVGPVTNLPMPRFVSLKSDEVNVRVGPGPTYPISWTYVRFGLPVEIIAEYENWRRVRDANGNEGWVLSNLLSGDRWVIVIITNDGANLTVRSEPSPEANPVAFVEPGVLARVDQCRNGWCRLTHPQFTGWAPQGRLWGVYADEDFN